jgi:hypothetical protein
MYCVANSNDECSERRHSDGNGRSIAQREFPQAIGDSYRERLDRFSGEVAFDICGERRSALISL